MPPSPSPARKRKLITDQGPHESAVQAVKIAYQRIESWKILRRPIRSDARPRTRLPTSEPASAALLTRPSMTPFRCQRPAKIGATNPTSRISIATNVHAIPVTSTALRWKLVRSRARSTSSTSRVATTGA